MASNPIQRRARQSFLIGFLIALVIMAVVVVMLFMKISKLNEEKEALIVKEITIYTTMDDIKSGEEVTAESLIPLKVKSEMDVSQYFTPGSFEYDDEGNAIKYFSKIDISAGTMITENMLYQEGSKTENDERIIEYNMIILPSQLMNGDYVDIRYRLPNGQDYIVLSKKYIEQTTTASIWMKMSETDIATLNSAIIDSYLVNGSKLYATKYTEPGMQEAAETTYAVSNDVLTAMNANPNILEAARKELKEKWDRKSNSNSDMTDYLAERAEIDGYTSEDDDTTKASTVESGVTQETTDIMTMRDEFVSALEGTGLVGTTAIY